ncbi:DDE-type integrase/transposase/recombinase [Methylomusa anaerophila]|uniref:Integrase core domain protein n=1 Tax=Methylomusa anaerophila TaxID=1930071 RepID=A0A348AQL5_9FIRM|nr:MULTISPECIES: DDE-type integrase/transposase/recombinase [Bacteria]BBB89408.1 integrase core domain protein [Methylomusa anaerophila]BBB90453.1 integrase core domain protein [Methylomusa anaerophila]BBB92240.1 integrase core domain protein [Methylomusa anaerophila]BBB92400.1 integrase core domain protein [Methylomusa anaerophila]BBB93363.1 integrase core domain protein [Methylomusa anaerophila]
MTNEDREQVALFRYGLIAPLLNDQVDSKQDYLSEICAKFHEVPYYGRKEFAPKTLEGWLRDYRRGGFVALKPKGRSDRGRSRVISPELKEQIIASRQKNRELSVVLFYEKLVKNTVLAPDKVSYHSVYRLLKSQQLLWPEEKALKERKRFSYDKVNILWQGDMSIGPYLTIGGKKLKTHLFAFIDDCSRLVPFAQFSFTEKFSPMKAVLKESILRRGVPKMIYVDNGKVYHARELHLACAALGITLTHTQPYDPQSKGKIERFFGTVRRRFYPLLANNMPKSLDDLNAQFWKWLESDYNRKPHSALDMSPFDLFLSQPSSVRLYTDPYALERLFFKREYRKVKHDATITLSNRLFEVPAKLVGQRIEVRYDPESPEQVYIYDNDIQVGVAAPVSFRDNSQVKRERRDFPKETAISFGSLLACQKEDV